MFRVFLYLLIPFSLLIHPASARNCGTGMGIVWQYGPAGDKLKAGTYTSADSSYAGQLIATINGNMSCEPDYINGDGSGTGVSQIIMQLNNGTRCKNSKTISIDALPGMEWQLSGMVCENNQLRSNATKTVSWDQRAIWPNGTQVGTINLYVGQQFWQSFRDNNQRSISVPTPSYGMGSLLNSPNINVGSAIGQSKIMNIYHQGTCSMNLSTGNLNFGRISPIDIKNGKVTREFQLDYSCINKAASNGLYLKFEPEHVINASQGTFSAKDKSGNNLIFKIGSPSSYKDPIPLNSSWQIIAPSISNVTRSVNMYVQAMPSEPFPSGSVSTYLNISLIYR